MEKNLEIIAKIMQKNGLMLTEKMEKQLKIYYEFLVEYNEKINLTAITEEDDVYLKHFADSALGIEFFRDNSTVCDIGTGAGFPGVVLKILRPDIKLFLVDSLEKRVKFLTQLTEKLELEDVKIMHFRAEDKLFKDQYLNSFDHVTARAVAQLNTLCEYCLPYVKVGGTFIAYKSSEINAELDNSKKAINILGGELNKVETISLVEDLDRSIIIFDKIKPTSTLYPRGQNKPRLKPLGSAIK